MASQSYYNQEPQDQGNSQYQMGPPQAQYPQPPPNYNPDKPAQATGNGFGGGKQPYDQAFKLERPKYNDLWAGILVLFHIPTI